MFQIKQSFTDFDDFIREKNIMEQKLHCNYYVLYSKPFKGESQQRFKYEYVTYCCKFGGRHTKRSSGVRISSSFRNGCQSRFCLKYNKYNENYVLTRLVKEHNHSLDEFTFSVLTNQRKLKDDEREYVKTIKDMGANHDSIREVFAKKGKYLISKDITNIISRHKNDLKMLHNSKEVDLNTPELLRSGGHISIHNPLSEINKDVPGHIKIVRIEDLNLTDKKKYLMGLIDFDRFVNLPNDTIKKLIPWVEQFNKILLNSDTVNGVFGDNLENLDGHLKKIG